MNKRMLDNQVAVISGALGDIGGAIACGLARAGAMVALSDVAPATAADALLERIEGDGGQATYTRVDVTDADAVARWIKQTRESLGPVTIAIPNAAVVGLKPILKIHSDDWSRELAVNLTGAMHIAQAAARQMVETRQPGRIVFVGSWAAHRPHPAIPAYCAAKAGVRMLMKVMALELAGRDILVNEVAPGYVDAGLSGQIFRDNPGARDSAVARVPVGRLIEPSDVAHEVLHLCDPVVRHTTGSTVLMDGGLSLLSGAGEKDE